MECDPEAHCNLPATREVGALRGWPDKDNDIEEGKGQRNDIHNGQNVELERLDQFEKTNREENDNTP